MCACERSGSDDTSERSLRKPDRLLWLVSTRRKLPCLLVVMGTDAEPGKRQPGIVLE